MFIKKNSSCVFYSLAVGLSYVFSCAFACQFSFLQPVQKNNIITPGTINVIPGYVGSSRRYANRAISYFSNRRNTLPVTVSISSLPSSQSGSASAEITSFGQLLQALSSYTTVTEITLALSGIPCDIWRANYDQFLSQCAVSSPEMVINVQAGSNPLDGIIALLCQSGAPVIITNGSLMNLDEISDLLPETKDILFKNTFLAEDAGKISIANLSAKLLSMVNNGAISFSWPATSVGIIDLKNLPAGVDVSVDPLSSSIVLHKDALNTTVTLITSKVDVMSVIQSPEVFTTTFNTIMAKNPGYCAKDLLNIPSGPLIFTTAKDLASYFTLNRTFFSELRGYQDLGIEFDHLYKSRKKYAFSHEKICRIPFAWLNDPELQDALNASNRSVASQQGDI